MRIGGDHTSQPGAPRDLRQRAGVLLLRAHDHGGSGQAAAQKFHAVDLKQIRLPQFGDAEMLLNPVRRVVVGVWFQGEHRQTHLGEQILR